MKLKYIHFVYVCTRIERIKDEKKEMNKKVRELTKRQKNLEEIPT
jgi:uncharacterized protein (UPF0335 family)